MTDVVFVVSHQDSSHGDPHSAAYDDTSVTAPDTIFRKLADTVAVRYAYTGSPGSITVDAELSTASGWRFTVPLRPTVDFDGSRYTGTVRLDLAALEDRAEAAARIIGIPATQVDLSVVPTVRTSDGVTFEPALAMTMTPLQLTLAADAASLTVPGPPSTSSVRVSRTLDLAGRSLPVTTARALSLAMTLGALLTAALLVLITRFGTSADEGATIRRRYASLLVPVQPVPSPSGRPVVDVVDFATLAKLAEQYGLLVLHWSRSGIETFVVQDEGTTYRYRTGSEAPTDQPPRLCRRKDLTRSDGLRTQGDRLVETLLMQHRRRGVPQRGKHCARSTEHPTDRSSRSRVFNRNMAGALPTLRDGRQTTTAQR